MVTLVSKPIISVGAARVNARLKQRDLAQKLGVTVSTIGNWENGRSEPDSSQLRLISELSGIPMDLIYVPEQS